MTADKGVRMEIWRKKDVWKRIFSFKVESEKVSNISSRRISVPEKS